MLNDVDVVIFSVPSEISTSPIDVCSFSVLYLAAPYWCSNSNWEYTY